MAKLIELSLFSDEELNACMVQNTTDDDMIENNEDINNNEEISDDKLDNSNVIRNISFDQKEILYNIMQLYNNGEPYDCDMTASQLKFYTQGKNDKYIIPEPKYLFDVYPQQDKIKKIEPFKRLPLEDGSINSIVVDLPFVISPKNCASMKKDRSEGSCIIANRFASFYPMEELIETIYWWLQECYRVLADGGIVVWKMQSTVSGGRQVWASPFSLIAADSLGFYTIDEFILEAKARLISATKIKKQMHSRKYTSNFYVFKKDKKMHKKNSILGLLDMCKSQNLENKVWPFK